MASDGGNMAGQDPQPIQPRDGGNAPVPANSSYRPIHRTDQIRNAIALILVVALAGVVFFGMFNDQPPDYIAQASSPLAGLAGIAIGWLFGGRGGGEN
jgi:hypothetical protein